MLSKAGFPLSNTQISNFFLEQEYTDYFRVQEVIGDLVDANLIHAESTHSNTQYSLTSAGKETLGFFKDKLNDGIENDVQGFFEKNKLEFRQENSILADYYKTTNQKYAVRCQVRSDGNPLIDLTLCVTTKEQAEAICNNWKKKSEDVYAVLMDTLPISRVSFFLFLYAVSKFAEFFPQSKIFSVRIHDKPGSVDVKFSCFIQIRIIHRHAKYFRHKHRMTAKRMALHHPAGNIYRTFRNCRSFHILHRNRCKSCFFKFIHISSCF